MNTRTFGVEIECSDSDYGCTCECSCEECDYCAYGCRESLGEDEECSCECECSSCYYCEWGCDGECRSSECEHVANVLHNAGFGHWCYGIHEDGSGVEIPSPVLSGREGLDELRRVMNLLTREGFYCTESDGLHVHHGADEWAQDEGLVAHTIEVWEENLGMIQQFVSPDRWGNMYCESHRGYAGYTRSAWEQFKDTKDTSLLRDKFKALNIAHLNTSLGTGTLEFRLHQGTLDFDKAASWIHFGQAFMEFAKRTYKRGEIVTCASAIDLLRQVNTSSKANRTLLIKAAA